MTCSGLRSCAVIENRSDVCLKATRSRLQSQPFSNVGTSRTATSSCSDWQKSLPGCHLVPNQTPGGETSCWLPPSGRLTRNECMKCGHLGRPRLGFDCSEWEKKRKHAL